MHRELLSFTRFPFRLFPPFRNQLFPQTGIGRQMGKTILETLLDRFSFFQDQATFFHSCNQPISRPESE